MEHTQEEPSEFSSYTLSYPTEERPVYQKWGLPQRRPYINIILFILTILSTYVTGGLWYSASIITILLCHEMGHFIMCRLYKVPATLPFFIPFPFANPFGTMGAVIQMKGGIPSRKALFDIGAGGPLAGLVVTLPIIFIGLSLSDVVISTPSEQTGLILGESLLFKALAYATKGPLQQNQDIMLHPVAYAGWAGLFVTALNLLPIGQLDGGHVMYSLFGEKSRYITYGFLLVLGIMAIFYPGWALLFALLVFFGRRHPAPWDDYTPIDRKRRILGYIIFIIFIISFTPEPFKL
ncbi:site-2 protease family protein [candidate division KSB1 bacterium]|nr:site-2 protease family protein [candidate division KSB1 bacterium]